MVFIEVLTLGLSIGVSSVLEEAQEEKDVWSFRVSSLADVYFLLESANSGEVELPSGRTYEKARDALSALKTAELKTAELGRPHLEYKNTLENYLSTLSVQCRDLKEMAALVPHEGLELDASLAAAVESWKSVLDDVNKFHQRRAWNERRERMEEVAKILKGRLGRNQTRIHGYIAQGLQLPSMIEQAFDVVLVTHVMGGCMVIATDPRTLVIGIDDGELLRVAERLFEATARAIDATHADSRGIPREMRELLLRAVVPNEDALNEQAITTLFMVHAGATVKKWIVPDHEPHGIEGGRNMAFPLEECIIPHWSLWLEGKIDRRTIMTMMMTDIHDKYMPSR